MLRVRAPPPASSGAPGKLFSEMKTAEKKLAQELRRKGHSMKMIERELGVARSTVSLWVREIELTDQQHADIALRGATAGSKARSACFRARRRGFQEEGRAVARRGEPLHAAGCMLHWAEGSKHRNSVQLSNSDPAMIELFARFLRHYFDVPDESLRLACNLFADHEEKQRENRGLLACESRAAPVMPHQEHREPLFALEQADACGTAPVWHVSTDVPQHASGTAHLRRDSRVRRLRAARVARLIVCSASVAACTRRPKRSGSRLRLRSASSSPPGAGGSVEAE
jgi:hypothetical protein